MIFFPFTLAPCVIQGRYCDEELDASPLRAEGLKNLWFIC